MFTESLREVRNRQPSIGDVHLSLFFSLSLSLSPSPLCPLSRWDFYDVGPTFFVCRHVKCPCPCQHPYWSQMHALKDNKAWYACMILNIESITPIKNCMVWKSWGRRPPPQPPYLALLFSSQKFIIYVVCCFGVPNNFFLSVFLCVYVFLFAGRPGYPMSGWVFN